MLPMNMQDVDIGIQGPCQEDDSKNWLSRPILDVLREYVVPNLYCAPDGSSTAHVGAPDELPNRLADNSRRAATEEAAEARERREALASLPCVCRDFAAAFNSAEHAAVEVRTLEEWKGASTACVHARDCRGLWGVGGVFRTRGSQSSSARTTAISQIRARTHMARALPYCRC